MNDALLSVAVREKRYRTYAQGAVVRSTASVVMWLYGLLALLAGEIQHLHFIGVSYSVLFLVLINPPMLFLFKRADSDRAYANTSLAINVLEILGYTAAIYSVGGIEATYLSPIYVILVFYMGIMSPLTQPFIIAVFCSLAFGAMVILDGLGIIPSQQVDVHFNLSLQGELFRAFAVITLLFVAAYISNFMVRKLNKARNRVDQKNIELENALKEITVLRGILRICSFCKKIRGERGNWEEIEVYINRNSQADFSHGLCRDCTKEHYPDMYEELILIEEEGT